MSGFNGLAIPGPTNMPFQIRRAMDVALQDHRAPDFSNFVLPLLRDVKDVFRTQEGHVLLFSGSGTLGWEAALTNTLSPGDKVLTAIFGQFSLLWANMCRKLGLQLIEKDVEWGMGIPLAFYEQALSADKSHDIKAVLVCHNETATGVTSDVAAVRKILSDLDHPALLMVDGVSSIGSIDFRMDEWGVDIAVAGSQKGFMMPTGLAIVGVSRKAIEATATAKLPRCFSDFNDMIKMNEGGYFPYTPATTLLHGLRASLDMMADEGLNNIHARHHRLATGVRKAVAAWGLNLCAKSEALYSDTVSAIVVPEDRDANDVIKNAYSRYNLSLGGGLTKVAGKVFRIGHLGYLNELMVLSALGGTEMAMLDSGIKIEAGSGVGAAIDYYRSTSSVAVVGKAT